MRSWTCIIGDRDSWWTKANQQCFSVTIVIKMQSKWYMRSTEALEINKIWHIRVCFTCYKCRSGRGQGEWRGAWVSDSLLRWTHARISSCSWPRIFFNKMYKKRCEERRNPSLGARRCEGTGRGESPDAKEEAAGTLVEEMLSSRGWRRRSSAGGGTTSASAPRGVERETRPRGTAGRGDFSPMFVGRAWFHGDIGLTRAGNPNVAGFQSHMSGSAWKDSAWAAGPGKWRGSRPGNGLPN